MIEASDNVVEPDAGTLNRGLAMVRDLGLSPVEEIGERRDNADHEAMLAKVNGVLAGRADLAMIEGQELMDSGIRDEALILKDNCYTSWCVFEQANPRVGTMTVQIYAGKTGLTKAVGADVHIGNLTTYTAIETEKARLGLGLAGRLS